MTQLQDFYERLRVSVDLRPIATSQLEQMAYLTQHTAEFTMRASASSAHEIQVLLASGAEGLLVEVRDRFGDYGVAGALIFIARGATLDLDIFLLNCRVMGKRVEHIILEKLAQIARARGCTHIQLRYEATARNAPAGEFIRQVGAPWLISAEQGATAAIPIETLDAIRADGARRDQPSGQSAPSFTLDTFVSARWRSLSSANRAQLLGHIASDLRRSDQILAAIHAHQRRDGPGDTQPYVAPRTPAEQALAEIWADVLNVERVGIHDHFFALGGDSILAIQVVSRARRQGMLLLPKQLFSHRTIAELASILGTNTAIQAEQGPISGPVPLTPTQHWFFEQQVVNPHHWNQSLLLDTRQPLDPNLLAQAIRHLVLHHDALRMRYRQHDDGWEQINAAPDVETPFSYIDLSAVPAAERAQFLQQAIAERQASLNICTGPLLHATYFDAGAEQPSQLFLAVHHLVVDTVSWWVLVDDLQNAYRQLSAGETIALAPKTTAYKAWAERLRDHAQTAAVRQELDFWRAQLPPSHAELPLDFPEGANTEGSTHSVMLEFSAAATESLLQAPARRWNVQINDVLLAALVQSLARWAGAQAVTIDMEGHGREAIFDDIDLSRTVGWFTAIYPIRIAPRPEQHPEADVRAIGAQLSQVPQRGVHYGVLRYLSANPQVQAALRGQPQAQISFSYLGQTDQAASDGPLSLSSTPMGAFRNPLTQRHHQLQVYGLIRSRRLCVAFGYSANLHRRANIERLVQDFRTAIATIAAVADPALGAAEPDSLAQCSWNEGLVVL